LTEKNLFQNLWEALNRRYFGDSAKKPPKNQIFVKNLCRFTAAHLKAFFLFFCIDFLHIDPSNNFCFCKFFAKGLKEAESWILVFGNGKNWQGSAKLSPLSLSPPPSEFCNHEKNSKIRSAMDALRNSKKN
jgi:hypothetical protein